MKNEDMNKRAWQSFPRLNEQSKALAHRVDELRLDLQRRDPNHLAAATGSLYDKDGFRLNLFRQTLFLPFPALIPTDTTSGKTLPVPSQALLLYYFSTADGAPLTGRWISFAELPDGRIYNQAYQGYTGDLLARRYGADPAGLERTSVPLDGGRVSYGDVGFAFLALPRVSLLAVLWGADDEFPASGKVLFDSSVVHYLPTDVCAILGSMLTRKLLAG
jgi:hypothetical protein